MHLTQLRCPSLALRLKPSTRQPVRYTIALLLALTASLKIASTFQRLPVLLTQDPLFTFLSLRAMMWGAAFMELILLYFVLRWPHKREVYLSVLWVCLIFVAYKTALTLLGYTGPCKCLGNVDEWLHLSTATIQIITSCIIAYIGLASTLIYSSLPVQNPYNQAAKR